MDQKLLSRDDFREGVFKRDNHKCVNCGAPGQDAHHIIERRLFPDGGYYLDNGATVCGPCHILAEETTLPPQTLRDKAGILTIVLPPHLYRDNEYDKWGNIVLPNGRRLKGELFNDESVQKIIKGSLHLFDDYVKYPRTYHLPWSPGQTKDDRVLPDTKNFEGREVVVTLKLDGENATLYRDYFHARSVTGDSHPSQGWIRNFHAGISFDIPVGWRFCGENLYAKHTLAYDDLESFFYLFSIWNERNECLSWDETVELAQILDIVTVPVIYRGIFDEKAIKDAFKPFIDKHEGYVVRITDSFAYGAFRSSVAKYVRKDHVGTSHNWRMEAIIPNKLKR